MGNWYGNVTLRGADATAAEGWLVAHGHHGRLLATGRDVVVFAAQADVGGEGPERLGRDLSAALDAPALSALVLDSDVLVLWLHLGGERRDVYVSDPATLAELVPPDESDGADRLDAGGGADAEAGTAEDAADGWDPPSGGDAAMVAAAFRVPDAAGLHEALHGGGVEEYTFVEDRHEAVVTALGLPTAAVGLGYAHLDEGIRPEHLPDEAVLRRF